MIGPMNEYYSALGDLIKQLGDANQTIITRNQSVTSGPNQVTNEAAISDSYRAFGSDVIAFQRKAAELEPPKTAQGAHDRLIGASRALAEAASTIAELFSSSITSTAQPSGLVDENSSAISAWMRSCMELSALSSAAAGAVYECDRAVRQD